jgi:hypothetical protein
MPRNLHSRKGNKMPNDKKSSTSSTTITTTSTMLPGIDNSQVIPSSPNLIKENSQTPTTKQKK